MGASALQRLVEACDGALGAALLEGGVIVDRAPTTEGRFEVEVVGRELLGWLKDVACAADILTTGELSEVVLRGGEATVMLRHLDQRRSLLLILGSSASLGKGRHQLRLAAGAWLAAAAD